MPLLLSARFALLAALQAQQPGPTIPESPIVRVVITPSTREVTAGDTVRFTAEARDASGRKIDNAIIRFVARGGEGEGEVDSCLLYTSPSPRDGLLSRMPSSA